MRLRAVGDAHLSRLLTKSGRLYCLCVTGLCLRKYISAAAVIIEDVQTGKSGSRMREGGRWKMKLRKKGTLNSAIGFNGSEEFQFIPGKQQSYLVLLKWRPTQQNRLNEEKK